jgi:hypothetical protein
MRMADPLPHALLEPAVFLERIADSCDFLGPCISNLMLRANQFLKGEYGIDG